MKGWFSPENISSFTATHSPNPDPIEFWRGETFTRQAQLHTKVEWFGLDYETAKDIWKQGCPFCGKPSLDAESKATFDRKTWLWRITYPCLCVSQYMSYHYSLHDHREVMTQLGINPREMTL